MANVEQIRKAVFEALDNAFENDYDWLMANPVDVADDLVRLDAGLETDELGSLVPHVKAWQESKLSDRRR